MNSILQGALKAFAASTWQTILVVAITVFIGWFRVQEQRWLFRSKRAKAFNGLLKDGRWRKVSSLEFHSAMIDAFGKTVERTELAFIMTRSRCAYLLRDRLAATGDVRFKPDCNGWEPVEAGVSGKKLRRRGQNYAIFGIIATGFALEFGLVSLSKLDSQFLLPLAVFCMLALAFFVLANRHEAAARVVDLDNMFPALVPMPAHLEANEPDDHPTEIARKTTTKIIGDTKPRRARSPTPREPVSAT